MQPNLPSLCLSSLSSLAWVALYNRCSSFTTGAAQFARSCILALGLPCVIICPSIWSERERVRYPINKRRTVPLIAAASAFGVLVLAITGGPYLIAHLALHPGTQTTGAMPRVDYRQVSFRTADGLVLRGWFLPGRNGSTVILVHGYARDRSELIQEAGWLVENGYSALVFDTRAQGSSDGAFVGMGYLEAMDIRAAVDFVLDESPEERIGLMGFSMGAVAAVQEAAQDARVQAVIAVSPFATLRETATYHLRRLGPLAPMIIWWGERMTGLKLDILRPVDAVSALAPRAILIMQAGDDDLVPPDSGRQLYAAAGEPKELWSVAGVAHVGFRQAVPEAYKQRILRFFERHLLLNH
jgi:fermentation-respiration switch protein FrsA (DUF1100 family)